jgi:ABC-type nitrate/sulfonate/bicarbonate transport system ATPase subunit
MHGGEPRLSVRIRSKSFGRATGPRTVLRDVAFDAGPGEVLALFGPSGTGKTTTLRIVLGLDHDFEGSVRRPSGRIGAVFQDPLLLPWMTVAENIRLVALPGSPAPDVDALLGEVGLPSAGGMLPREISLGMARRVALARAFGACPSLLVLDEPFASLDARLSVQLARIVARRAHQDGTGVLLTTHDLGQAMAIATRILILHGEPATLAADHAVPRGERAMGQLREDLHQRFPFLAHGAPEATLG